MARPAQISSADIALHLQAGGALAAQALADRLGVDRSTISRGLGRMGENVVTLGAARRARYALRRPVRSAGDRWPIYRIDAMGRSHEWARLHALHGGFWIEWSGEAPAWAERVFDREGFLNGFPFFLGDLRPQGFLGRQQARRVAELLRLPADPRQWGDDDTLVFLQAEGSDLPGDLVVGDLPMRRVLARVMEPVSEGEVVDETMRVRRYPELAALASSGGLPGSSAGGEQPKFLTMLRGEGAVLRRVLVKFSPPMETAVGRRWADLLAAEAHALAVLAEAGLATAGARVLDAGGRRFLEVTRHDRAGTQGRRGVVSFAALHAALAAGSATGWSEAADALARDGLIDASDLGVIHRLHSFGELIGNSDMHFGNLSFWLDDARLFRPTPAYDMLPMLWAPNSQGEVIEPEFAPRLPLPGVFPAWRDASGWAVDFWRRVAEDATLSSEFAVRARNAAEHVERTRTHLGVT